MWQGIRTAGDQLEGVGVIEWKTGGLFNHEDMHDELLAFI